MASKIEEIIDEIENYIDECKPVAFSSNTIKVNKDDLESMLEELRKNTPEEIRRYQKIISNKEQIISDAQAKADAIISKAEITTNELVSEHQIMQQAYAQANEVIQIANNNAQDILNQAQEEANAYKMGAMTYADSILGTIEKVISGTIDTTATRMDSYIQSMQGYLTEVVNNRAEISPIINGTSIPAPATAAPAQAAPVEEAAPSEDSNNSGLDIPLFGK